MRAGITVNSTCRSTLNQTGRSANRATATPTTTAAATASTSDATTAAVPPPKNQGSERDRRPRSRTTTNDEPAAPIGEPSALGIDAELLRACVLEGAARDRT